MMSHEVVKTMERLLTPVEEKEIRSYVLSNRTVPFNKIISLFENKFQTTITITCITRICVEVVMEI